VYDKFKTYEKNHNTIDVKNIELKKISKDEKAVKRAHRKIRKYKYHNIEDLEEHYDDILQAEHFIKKTCNNIATRKKRLQILLKTDMLNKENI
jgi:hypothetical protein